MTEDEFWEDQKYDYVARDKTGEWYSFLTAPVRYQFTWDIKGHELSNLLAVPRKWNDLKWKDSLKVRPPNTLPTPSVEDPCKSVDDLIEEIQAISDVIRRKSVESAVLAARHPDHDNLGNEAHAQIIQSDMATKVVAECIGKIKEHFGIES